MSLLTDRSGRFSALKTCCLLALLAPAAWLLWRWLNHDLGPRAITEALHFTGQWAVRFLLAALALTPLMRLSRWTRLALIRRMLGVGAFAWAAGHLFLYVISVKYDIAFAASEIINRYYLTIGFAALVGLTMLAATSTDAMIARLGNWWKRLHRLVYVIATLAILHFFMQSKLDASEATLMAGLFLTLMIYRAAFRVRRPVGPTMLAAVAATAAVATAIVEFAWYGLATGANPWRVLQANLHPERGLRPAVIVLLVAAGLGVATEVWRRFQEARGGKGTFPTGRVPQPRRA
ncbi:MAG: ferric reductase-like transmembrane domain-containing protein [Hyphomicrobiales bacterium]